MRRLPPELGSHSGVLKASVGCEAFSPILPVITSSSSYPVAVVSQWRVWPIRTDGAPDLSLC